MDQLNRLFLVIVVLVFAVMALSGSFNNSTPNQEYNVLNSTFQIGSDWWAFNDSNSTNDSVIFNNDQTLGLVSHMNLCLTQYTNATTFESKYQDSKSSSDDSIVVNTENKSIAGIQVKFINTTGTKNNETFQDYYFQKNGKYYSIHIVGKSDVVNELYVNQLKFSVESIISTIN